MNKRNDELVKSLEQTNAQLNQNYEMQLETQFLNGDMTNKSEKKILKEKQSLPQIGDVSSDKRCNNDQSSYYDPDIKTQEHPNSQVKQYFGSHQKSRSISKVSGQSLHEMVNKQLQSIRQSRKSLHSDLSFTSLNQLNQLNQTSYSIDNANPNYIDKNNSSGTNTFIKRDISQQDMQTYLMNIKEEKMNMPYYLQNTLPHVNSNSFNPIDMISNQNSFKYHHLPTFKTESIQMKGNITSNNTLDSYQPRYSNEQQSSPVHSNITKKLKRRNQILYGQSSNTNACSQTLELANQKGEFNQQHLSQQDTNEIGQQTDQNYQLNRSKARKDFSQDSKISHNYSVNDINPIQITQKSKNQSHQKNKTQRITVVRKLNITETTIHKIKQSDLEGQSQKESSDDNNEQDDQEEQEEDKNESYSHRFIPHKSNENCLKENSIKKIIILRDSYDQNIQDQNQKDTIESIPSLNGSVRIIKNKFIPKQGFSQMKYSQNSNKKQKDTISLNNSFDERSNLQSGRKQEISKFTPSKADRLNMSIDNENGERKMPNSLSLPPIQVQNQQDNQKKLLKIKGRNNEMQQEDEQYDVPIVKVQISPCKKTRSQFVKQANRKRLSNGQEMNQQNFRNDASLSSHTHVQLNLAMHQQQQQQSNNNSSTNIISTHPILNQNKYMPEIQEEFSQSSRQCYTDGRISSHFTRAGDNNTSSLAKNFTPDNLQQIEQMKI